jgi:hypothetical protein
MTGRLCSTGGCGRVAKQRGLCARCYRERARAGTLPPAESYSGPTLPDLAAIGVTYRQLDYWVRTGRIRVDEPTPGSGQRRTWPDGELEVAARIGRLLKAGLSLAEAAHVARNPHADVELAPGVHVRIEDPAEVAS